MSNRAYARMLIAELGQSLGLNMLRLDEADRCSINFDGKIDVEIEYNRRNNTLFLSSDLGLPKSEDPLELYSRLLSANLNGQEAAQVLALDRETGSLIQFCTLYLFNISGFRRFEAILENFVNRAVDWRDISHGNRALADSEQNGAGCLGTQEPEDEQRRFDQLNNLA